MAHHDICPAFNDVLRWRTARLGREATMDEEHKSESLSEWAEGFRHGRSSTGYGISGPPANPYVPPGNRSDPYEDGWKTGFAFGFLANEIRRELRAAKDAVLAAGG